MSILFLGTSPSDLGGITQPHTGTEARDAAFTPVASRVTGDFDASGGGFVINHGIPSGDLWVHFISNFDAVNASGNVDGWWCRFMSGTDQICRVDVQDGQWRLESSTGTFVDIPNPATLQDITWDFKISYSGGDFTFEMFLGGVSQTSITWTSALPMPDRLFFDHYDLMYAQNASDYFYSEFIVTDGEPTLGWRLSTLTPASDGFYNQWDGSYLGISAIGDGQNISTPTANLRQSWGLSAYGGPATTSGVRAVVNKILAGQGASGPTQITPFTRHGSTDVDGTTFTPNGQQLLVVMDNNPDTGLTWDTADLATLQVGVKSTT